MKKHEKICPPGNPFSNLASLHVAQINWQKGCPDRIQTSPYPINLPD